MSSTLDLGMPPDQVRSVCQVLQVRKGHQKDTCQDEFELCEQNVDAIPSSVARTIERADMITTYYFLIAHSNDQKTTT